MTRSPLLVALVALVVAAPMAVAALPAATQTPTDDGDARPGERLSGSVAAQQAEFDGELQARTFEQRLASTNNSSAKAAIVAGEVENVEQRLAELRERKQRLVEARRNGSISRAEFRTKMAELAARTATLRRLANRSEQVARGLPEQALAEQGVNVSAIRRLQQNAANLTGPAVARIARSVAGREVGGSMGGGPPDDVPGANRSAGNGSDRGPGNGQGPGNEAGNGNDRGAQNGSDRGAGNETDGTGDGSEGNQGNGDSRATLTAPTAATPAPSAETVGA